MLATCIILVPYLPFDMYDTYYAGVSRTTPRKEDNFEQINNGGV